jgi:hypothetical protein
VSPSTVDLGTRISLKDAPADHVALEKWLGESSGRLCDCGLPMARWEALNGACISCRHSGAGTCKRTLTYGRYCAHGFHWLPDIDYPAAHQMARAYERCPR